MSSRIVIAMFENYWVLPNGSVVSVANHGKAVASDPEAFGLAPDQLPQNVSNYEYSKLAMDKGAIRITIMAGDIVMAEFDTSNTTLNPRLRDVLFSMERQDSTIEISNYLTNDHRVYRGVDDWESTRTAAINEDLLLDLGFSKYDSGKGKSKGKGKKKDKKEDKKEPEVPADSPWYAHPKEELGVYYMVGEEAKKWALEDLGERAVQRQEMGKGAWAYRYDSAIGKYDKRPYYFSEAFISKLEHVAPPPKDKKPAVTKVTYTPSGMTNVKHGERVIIGPTGNWASGDPGVSFMDFIKTNSKTVGLTPEELNTNDQEALIKAITDKGGVVIVKADKSDWLLALNPANRNAIDLLIRFAHHSQNYTDQKLTIFDMSNAEKTQNFDNLKDLGKHYDFKEYEEDLGKAKWANTGAYDWEGGGGGYYSGNTYYPGTQSTYSGSKIPEYIVDAIEALPEAELNKFLFTNELHQPVDKKRAIVRSVIRNQPSVDALKSYLAQKGVAMPEAATTVTPPIKPYQQPTKAAEPGTIIFPWTSLVEGDKVKIIKTSKAQKGLLGRVVVITGRYETKFGDMTAEDANGKVITFKSPAWVFTKDLEYDLNKPTKTQEPAEAPAAEAPAAAEAQPAATKTRQEMVDDLMTNNLATDIGNEIGFMKLDSETPEKYEEQLKRYLFEMTDDRFNGYYAKLHS